MSTHAEWLPPLPDSSRSLFRITVSFDVHERFADVLMSIRPEENKIIAITPGPNTWSFDVIISDEELVILKLAVPIKMYSWLRIWEENDRK